MSKNRFGPRKSEANTIESKESKPEKVYKLSRKEARARIGLGDIPDEKIENKVKVKKERVKITKSREGSSKPLSKPVPTFQYTNARSRQNSKPRIANTKSTDGTRGTKAAIKETVKIKFPETGLREDVLR